MRKLSLMAVAAAALVALGALAGYTAGAQDRRTLKPNQVARVGENVITAEQLIQRVVEIENLMMAPDRRVDAALDTLVVEQMLKAEAARIDEFTGGQLKPREVQVEVDAMLAQAKAKLEAENRDLVAQQRKAGQPERPWTWPEWLKMRLNMTETEFNQLLTIRARNDLLKRLVVWYWFRTSHNIHVLVIQTAGQEAIQDVQKRLATGEDFSVLASARSIHEASKRQNTPGQLNDVIRGDGSLPKAVDDAAWKLSNGQTSDPIAADDGTWYIVRRVATNKRVPNEAKFVDQRDDCLKAPNVSDQLFERWRNSVANSGLYAYEIRVPGRDNVEADK